MIEKGSAKNNTHTEVIQNSEQLLIRVQPIISKTHSVIILVWLLLWTLCGLIVFTQFFAPISRENKILMAAWMAFWAFFEFRVFTVYQWKKSGYEEIEIQKERFILRKKQAGPVKEIQFHTDELSALSTVDFNERKYSPKVNSSFFSLGLETISFKCGGNIYRFGYQLTKEEGLRIMKLLKNKLPKSAFA
jgi:hypothetical protein